MPLRAEHKELLNASIMRLLADNEVRWHYCRKVSDAATHLDLKLNEHGMSEEWDRSGVFCPRAKTIYLADEGWEGFNEPYRYSETDKLQTFGHETSHAIDFCLGQYGRRPSLSNEFWDAWQADIANVSLRWPAESNEKIMGRLLEEVTGMKELWADFGAYAITGLPGAVGTAYFPLALNVFNREVSDLGLGPIRLRAYRQAIDAADYRL